jgi:arylsulfatase
LKGKLVFLYNLLDLKRVSWLGRNALSPGNHTLEVRLKYDGPRKGQSRLQQRERHRPRRNWRAEGDGKEVARQTTEHSIPLIMQWDENFGICVDTGTPVPNDYQVPFRFTGKLTKLTLIDRRKLTPEI